MTRFSAERLVRFIDLDRHEQFLRTCKNGQTLLRRLNQVLLQVKLSPVPVEAVEVVAAGRLLVYRRLLDLLSVDHYS